MDEATSVVSRGHFARICVELDLKKPLVSKFRLRRRIRRLEYEGLHLVCFGCGMYGHRRETCPQEDKTLAAAPVTTEGLNAEGIQTTKSIDRIRKEEIAINLEILKNFGPWMLAPCRSRRNQRN